jgi:hypothetical protein
LSKKTGAVDALCCEIAGNWARTASISRDVIVCYSLMFSIEAEVSKRLSAISAAVNPP